MLNFKKKSRRNVLGAIASAAVLSLTSAATFGVSATQAVADTFPSKPITVVVPFKPGGRTDVVARLIANKIEENGWLPQPMVIVNVPGGAGANAVQRMQDGDADGHTIVHWHHQSLIAMAMELGGFGLEDFRSLGYTGGGSPVWMVREDSEFQTLDELIAHSKENPRSLIEAVGIGSIAHFVGALLQQDAGFETRLVTANSGADRNRLLLGGNADIALDAASGFIRAGEGKRALVYFGRERLPEIPTVPTALELGYDVTWANPNWWLAPAGTPDEAAAVLSEALSKAIADPEIQAYFESNALAPFWTDGDAAMTDSQELLSNLETVAASIK